MILLIFCDSTLTEACILLSGEGLQPLLHRVPQNLRSNRVLGQVPFWSWRHLCARRPVRPHRQLGTALEAGGPTQLGLGTEPRAAAVPLRPRLQATLFWGLASPLPRLRRLHLTPQPRQLPGAAQHFLCLWPGHCLPCPEFLPAVSFHNNKNIRFCSAESGRRWDGHQACAGQGRCVWEAGGLWPRDGPALLRVDPGSSLSAFCSPPPCALMRESPGFQGQLRSIRRGRCGAGPPGGHLASASYVSSVLL